MVVGHVPPAVISHLLKTRPKIAGIGVPGMPPGSPGMESRSPVPYDVVAWRGSGEPFVYAQVGADGSIEYPK